MKVIKKRIKAWKLGIKYEYLKKIEERNILPESW